MDGIIMKVQLTLSGNITAYYCHRCPFTAMDQSDIQKHIKKAHAKQYKKCRMKGCHNMILNNIRHRFCTSCLEKFESEHDAVYANQIPIPIINCKICNEPVSQHSFEQAEECVETFADSFQSMIQEGQVEQ